MSSFLDCLHIKVPNSIPDSWWRWLLWQGFLFDTWWWALSLPTGIIHIRKYCIHLIKEERVRATLESSSKWGRISSCQEFQNFENWKWEIEKIVCELKESENHLSTSFEKLWVVVGGGWVHCDYNISSAPFVSELRLWEWNLEIWAEMSRSQAWQKFLAFFPQ